MIRMKIAFALRLLNDFSGNSIKEKGFHFYINERIIHPVVKEDGIYVDGTLGGAGHSFWNRWKQLQKL